MRHQLFSDTFDANYYGGLSFFAGAYLGIPYYTEYTSIEQVIISWYESYDILQETLILL